ncbi:hypothetical protein GQ457_13G008700 [Hibiscus cannabinus]
MDISLLAFLDLTLKHTSTSMHVQPLVPAPTVPLPTPQPGPISYKDTLMVTKPIQNLDATTFEIDEEVSFTDRDVIRSTVDGLISIVFSERVQVLAAKSLDLTVVVKLLGRRSRVDFTKAISGGPWMLFGHYLVVEPWTVDFSTSQPHPSRVVVWIRLSGLLVTLYQKIMITTIGECIGPVIQIDYQSESGRREHFAKMAISIDFRKPLILKLLINGRIQVVEYESFPTICFECGKYGHVKYICPKVNSDATPTSGLPDAFVVPPPVEPFGPWMRVERQQCHTMRKGSHP